MGYSSHSLKSIYFTTPLSNFGTWGFFCYYVTLSEAKSLLKAPSGRNICSHRITKITSAPLGGRNINWFIYSTPLELCLYYDNLLLLILNCYVSSDGIGGSKVCYVQHWYLRRIHIDYAQFKQYASTRLRVFSDFHTLCSLCIKLKNQSLCTLLRRRSAQVCKNQICCLVYKNEIA